MLRYLTAKLGIDNVFLLWQPHIQAVSCLKKKKRKWSSVLSSMPAVSPCQSTVLWGEKNKTNGEKRRYSTPYIFENSFLLLIWTLAKCSQSVIVHRSRGYSIYIYIYLNLHCFSSALMWRHWQNAVYDTGLFRIPLPDLVIFRKPEAVTAFHPYLKSRTLRCRSALPELDLVI